MRRLIAIFLIGLCLSCRKDFVKKALVNPDYDGRIMYDVNGENPIQWILNDSTGYIFRIGILDASKQEYYFPE